MKCCCLFFWLCCCFFCRGQFLPVSEGEIVVHAYYTLSFNDTCKQANWVYYVLDLDGRPTLAERNNKFKKDKKVSTSSALSTDYIHSGYDRGHLCPAADMAFSAEAMDETFYMSNMSPQVPAFNRGIWKKLEEKVRNWGRREKIHIATGPVFKENKGRIGKSRVFVPGYFYKVVYAPEREQMIAFLLPNAASRQELTDFIVSVDKIEELTGIDFFSQLADTLENRLEACSDYQKWTD